MKKRLMVYILIFTWLFALLDWKVIHLTRWQDREYSEWMHSHEQQYALVTRSAEWILCAPCMPLKPIFQNVMVEVEASTEEQNAITHAPLPDLKGFYHLPKRGESWTFVSWSSWFMYWMPSSILWWLLVKKLGDKMKFIVTQTFKDGGLMEQMSKENLPVELMAHDAIHRHYVYECSVGLLRSLRNAGCLFVILPNDPTELEDFLYIFDMKLKD